MLQSKFTSRNYGDETFLRTHTRNVVVTSTRTRCRNKFAKNPRDCTCRVRVHIPVQVRMLNLSNVCALTQFSQLNATLNNMLTFNLTVPYIFINT